MEVVPPVEANPSETETAEPSQDQELTALLQSFVNDTAQAGGEWAVAVQRADEEQCCAVSSKQ